MIEQISRTRSLRKRLTPQEVKVWVKLRDLRPLGFHFRHQVPIGPYILDFACKRSRLVVEIDGGRRKIGAIADADQTRDSQLRAEQMRVLRFWNSDVDHNLAGVIEMIVTTAQHGDPHLARKSAPPSPKGEG